MWKQEDFMAFTELARRRNLWFRLFPGQTAAELQGKRKREKIKALKIYIVKL